MSVVLRVDAIGKRYGAREALRAITFDVDAGELVAIVGANGAGKTTLLSILAGVLAPSSGTVAGPAGHVRVGWAPQQPALYSRLSVAENLRLFARLERVGDPRGTAERLLDQMGLAERGDERIDRLSTGSRQRVNVALGLLADPPVLVLDEPAASFDPAQRARLWALVAELAHRGTAVVFSTHTPAEAERVAGRVILLDEGEMLFDGRPAELCRATGLGPDAGLEEALLALGEARAAR